VKITVKLASTIAILAVGGCLVIPAGAQQPLVERPQGPLLWRPYRPASVSPAALTNSSRLGDLIRAGRLYLTLQDAIALAIENNLDLEVERYGPLSAEWNLERQRAGGPLKGVTGGNSVVNQITNGQGVLGAEQAAGLLINNGNSGANTQSNGSVSQIGPITPNLDAVFQNSSAWSHTTSPQSNQEISQTPVLIDTAHKFTSFVQQGLLSGGFVQVGGNENYLKENSPNDVLNPSYAPIGQVYVRHNFLQGFGVNVNSRYIRIAERQVVAANLSFQTQLLNLIANVADLYWALVSAQEDVDAKQRARDYAEKFHQQANNRIEAGAMSGVNIYRTRADLSARQQELSISEANVSQWEIALKAALSRNGLGDPLLDAAKIVPLDHIQIPESDDLPPLRELVERALAKRPDLARDQIDDQVRELSALGTSNALLPQLQGIAYFTDRAEAGGVNPTSIEIPDAYQVGGLGTAVGQIFRHDYGSSSGGVVFQAPLHNHLNQGDYGIDRLQLRQGKLVERQSRNQLVVDISNQMAALRQARARYTNAADARALDEQLLEAEQQKFALGNSTIDDVVNAERALVGAQSVEVSTRAQYSHARVALDEVVGETLGANHVSLDDALKGSVSNISR